MLGGMDAADWLLLMVAARAEDPIDPVRLQKGLFLLAMEGGLPPAERYAFEPYSYGPMSRAIYRDVRRLETAGLVERVAVPGFGWRALRATPAGVTRAGAFPAEAVEAVRGTRAVVDRRSFADLLEYVYERYPEYATRSVFRRR